MGRKEALRLEDRCTWSKISAGIGAGMRKVW